MSQIVIARPDTIEKAIEVTCNATPPPRQTSKTTMKQWRADNERRLRVLNQVRKQRAFLDAFSPGSFAS